MNKPCVVPVATDDALEWAAGRLDDKDLLLRSPIVPHGIFIVNLADRREYRQLLKHVLYWYLRGAVFLVARTGNQALDLHMSLKNGCIRMFQEEGEPVMHRFVCPPAAFKNWISKWGRSLAKSPPAGQPRAKSTVIL